MSMTSDSLPYMGSSLENLTLSDPRCRNDSCKAFYDAHQLSQKLVSYSHQFDYGHYVTWYYLTFIGLFAITFALRRWSEYHFSRSSGAVRSAPSLLDQMKAVWRYFAYRRQRGRMSHRFGLPSVGMLVFITLAILYSCLLTFWARPYYRPHRGYGSPPIAVRTGLMAVALTPLIIALSGKANMITMLTGIGHEKLNIIHRWVAWLCFGLSVVHTIPFIVAPLKDGGYAALHKQYYKPGGFEYTGTPPFAILFGLLLFSIPWIRHRFYEAFYHLHFWLAVAYIGLMFWHCGQEGDSWVYMWASIAIWISSILGRAFWFTKPTNVVSERWFVGSQIVCECFADNMTRLDILAPEQFHWKPGQHVYLRMPAISYFDNHPFTIASSDWRPKTNKHNLPDTPRVLPVYVRSHAGFTRRLQHYLSKNADVQLEGWLEGPYGGHHLDLSSSFDNLILVAGGGGISAILPWFEHIILRTKHDDRIRTSSMKLFWSIKDPSAISWITEALEKLDVATLGPQFTVEVHITQGEMLPTTKQAEKLSRVDDKDTFVSEASPISEKMWQQETKTLLKLRNGRIDFENILADLPRNQRTMVVGCGPESLKVDLSNACAAAQSQIASRQVKEIALWTETFGW